MRTHDPVRRAPATATFHGLRDEDGCLVLVVGAAGLLGELDPRLDLWNHSPAGFEWGYGGSGPAQLAVALLACCCTDALARSGTPQLFKRQVVATWPRHGFGIGAADVRRWAAPYCWGCGDALTHENEDEGARFERAGVRRCATCRAIAKGGAS